MFSSLSPLYGFGFCCGGFLVEHTSQLQSWNAKPQRGEKNPTRYQHLIANGSVRIAVFFLSSFSAQCLMTPYCFEVDSESPRHFAPLDYMESPEEIFRRRHDDKEVTFPSSSSHFSNRIKMLG